jgi:hypothetical protein
MYMYIVVYSGYIEFAVGMHIYRMESILGRGRGEGEKLQNKYMHLYVLCMDRVLPAGFPEGKEEGELGLIRRVIPVSPLGGWREGGLHVHIQKIDFLFLHFVL